MNEDLKAHQHIRLFSAIKCFFFREVVVCHWEVGVPMKFGIMFFVTFMPIMANS